MAKDFPGTSFGVIDASVPAPNVASLTFAAEQGAFLAGAAAARKSHSGKLGFVGGVDTDAAHLFQAGFVAGARRVNPGATVDVRYLTQPPDLSGIDSSNPLVDVCEAIVALFEAIVKTIDAIIKLVGDIIKMLASPGSYLTRLAL